LNLDLILWGVLKNKRPHTGECAITIEGVKMWTEFTRLTI